jgi:hypothetical protein
VREQSDTRRELEAAARRLVGEGAQAADGAAGALKSAGPALGVLALLGAYAWGRRRGRRRSARVEVKRRR